MEQEKTFVCGNCSEEVDINATECPYCGAEFEEDTKDNDQKQIKIFDRKKWLIKVFVSMGIWGFISLFFLNKEADDVFTIFYIMMFIMVCYWIYAYITTNKYVEESKVKQSDHIRGLVCNKEDKERNNTSLKTSLLVGGLITLLSSGIFVACLGGTKEAFLFFLILSAIIIMPISYLNGKDKQFSEKLKNVLPIIYSKLEEKGYSVSEKYISPIGTGVILDKTKQTIIIIIGEQEKYFIFPIAAIKSCKLIEEKGYKILSSESGTRGTVLNNDRLKEFGKYAERDILKYYTALGIDLIIQFDNFTKRVSIPFINRKRIESSCIAEKELAINAVDNINMMLSTANNTLIEAQTIILDELKDLEKRKEYYSEVDRINKKIKNMQKLTKEEIETYSLDNSIVNEEETQKILYSYQEELKHIKRIFDTNNPDFKKITTIINKSIKLLSKDEVRKKDFAYVLNYNIDVNNIMKKHYQGK